MNPSKPVSSVFSFTATQKIVESDGFVYGEAKGQKDAQREVALVLERWMKAPLSILDKKGNINPDKFDAALKSFQNANGLAEDFLIGRKTMRHLMLAASILEAQPATRQTSSCNVEGLKDFKGFDCPKLERFAAGQAQMKPNDLRLLDNLKPLLNLSWQSTVGADDPSAPTRLADATPKPPRERS